MTDTLSPGAAATLADWAARVRADLEQVERCREVDDPADFYAPVASRFTGLDPRRTDDAVLTLLLEHARSDETWLDVGAGGGRYALPLAARVREVIAVEPSPSMVGGLTTAMREHGIANLRVLQQRWPMADAPTADVGLIAHIGYDIADIGPFLDALEASSRRLCIAVMGQSAMTTIATLFWEQIHGEPRVRLPAMPELLVVLLGRGRLPQVRLVDRPPSLFASVDEALAVARRQLWLREGSVKDRRLRQLAIDALAERAGGCTFDREPSKIGIVSWQPTQER